jgi:hypothetical protein
MLLGALEAALVTTLRPHTLLPVGGRKRLSCALLPNGGDITSNFVCEVTIQRCAKWLMYQDSPPPNIQTKWKAKRKCTPRL